MQTPRFAALWQNESRTLSTCGVFQGRTTELRQGFWATSTGSWSRQTENNPQLLA